MEGKAAKPSSLCSPCQSTVCARRPLSSCKHGPMPGCKRGHGAVDPALGRRTGPCKPGGQGQPPPLLLSPACKRSEGCKLSTARLGLGAGSAPAFPPTPMRNGERWRTLLPRLGGPQGAQGGLYLQVSPLQQDQLRALDVMPDKNVSVLPQTKRFQPSCHLLGAPFVR